MAIKSVVEIDLHDDRFKNFLALYNQYAASLKNMPAAWALVNKKIDGSRSSFDKLVDKMVAQNVYAKIAERAQERADRLSRTTAERWQSMARNTRTVALNIADATLSLLRWGALTGVISGILGGGGLFGIDRLALGVAAGRRSSLGLGVGYGDQRAFDANFARLVDPNFLSNVSGAKLDVTRRVGLIGAGLTPGEINGSTADTAVALLRNLKRIADTTNPALYAQIISSRRLEQFTSPEDLQRLRNTSPQEIAELISRYSQNRRDFDLSPDVARKWQEFTTQMTRAGQGIENTFVRGLAPLAPGLTRLSESAERVIKAFLASPTLEKWIKDVGDALETFAGYVGTEKFQQNVKDFAKGVGDLAEAVGAAAKWILGLVRGESLAPSLEPSNPDNIISRFFRDFNRQGSGVGVGQSQRFRPGPENNPGNLRPPGASTGFQGFATPEDGVRAMARQLLLYANRDHLDTLSGVIGKYAPKSENDTASYIGDVSKKTGFDPNQHLDLNDRATLASVLSAMISHEQRRGSYDKYKDSKVTVEVINTTGGNAVTTVNGMKN